MPAAVFTPVLRRWRRRPALPALAGGVLVLGVGTSTAMLGLGYATVLRPLPYPDEARLVVVNSEFPGMRLRGMGLSGPEATELATLTSGFSAIGFGYATAAAVMAGQESVQAQVAAVSAGLLDALDPLPTVGRRFTSDEDRPNGPRRVLVGERFWRTALAARSTVLGEHIAIDGRPHEIVGVLPRRVHLLNQPIDLWVPLQYDVRAPDSNRANHAFIVIGRSRPEYDLSAIGDDVRRAVARWMSATGHFHAPDPKMHPLAVTPLRDAVGGAVRPAAIVLAGSVGLVLMVALANAAALLMAAADARQAEMAIRAALGASRRTLWALQATESVLLSAISGIGAVFIANAATGAIAALAPPQIATPEVVVAWHETAALGAVVTLLAAAVCSIGPLGRLPLARLATVLSAGGRPGTGAPARQIARRVFVGVEVALALVLVTGAAVLGESAWRLTRVDPGFRHAGTLRAFLNLPASYTTRDRVDAFYSAVLTELARQPGARGAAVMTGLPPIRRANNSTYLPDAARVADIHAGLPPMEFVQQVSPAFFDLLDVPLRAGRRFTDADRADSEPVAIVNDRAAAVFFPGGPAVGRRIRSFGANLPWLTIVGVVGDMHQAGLDRDPGTELFVPIQQAASGVGAPLPRNLHLVVRADRGDPMALGAVLRRTVARLDPTVAVSNVETMTAVVDRSTAGPRFLAAVLGAFAGVAVLLSSAGVYGIVRYAVAARAREIGVRRALGASHGRVLALIARQLTWLLAGGVAVGLGAVIAGVRLLEPFTFGVQLDHAGRLALLATGMAFATAAAAAGPIAKALRIDPGTALKDE